MLSMFDELFLLALDEERGNIAASAKKTIAYGLSGAILAELAFLGKLCVNAKHRLELVNSAPTGDEVLDEVLQEIQASEKPRKVAYWISQISDRPKKLRERLGERLVEQNVLVQDDRHFFPRLASSGDEEPAAPTKFEIKQLLRAMILSTGKNDHRSLALLGVAGASGLLNLVFTQDELVQAGRRIHEEVVRSALENPAMETIQAIEQAISTSLEDDLD